MPPETPDQPETEVRQPRGWVLSAVFVLVTAPLVAGFILAYGLLKTTLSTQGMIDLENGFVDVGFAILQFVAAGGIVQAVFFVFRARYHIRQAIPEEGESNLASTYWAFGAFLLSIAMLFGAYRLGLTAGKPDNLDIVALAMAFFALGQWPLRSLLEANGRPPGPDDVSVQANGTSG